MVKECARPKKKFKFQIFIFFTVNPISASDNAEILTLANILAYQLLLQIVHIFLNAYIVAFQSHVTKT